MENSAYLKHKIFLTAVFLLGNTVIVFPKGAASQFSFYGCLLALLFNIAFCFIIANIKNMPNIFVLKILFAVFCFIILGITLRDYVNFVDTARLPQTPRFLISVIYIFISVYLGVNHKKAIYLFSFFSFFIIFAVFIIMLILSVNKISLSNLNLKNFNFSGVLNQSLTFYIHSFGQLIVLTQFFKNLPKQKTKVIYFGGGLIGFVMILIYVFNILAVLGTNVLGNINYPYATLTGMVSFAGNYSRMDGFTYYLYFFSTLIKSAVIINVIINLFKNKKIIIILIFISMVLITNINAVQNILHSNPLNLIILIFEITFPVLVLVINKWFYVSSPKIIES